MSSAPNTTRKPELLLQFHQTYSVLICSACGYALKPTGIARHLKEIHHITRSTRRPYMSHASRFQLADTKQVLGAEIREFPIRLLPVVDGLQCLGTQGCEFLCVSVKAMQRHWLSAHGRSGSMNDWKSTPLQTFFRGNLLRYFTAPTHSKSENVGHPSFTKSLGRSKYGALRLTL